MTYRWRDLSFEAPDGRDDSAILLLDRADPPAWNLLVRVDDLPGGAAAFPAWVAGQAPPPGATIEAREETTVAGRPAVVVEQHLEVDGGRHLHQQQAFVLQGATVVVATMTARTRAHGEAKAAFDRLLTTLSFHDGGAK